MGMELTFAESTAIVIGLTALAEISLQLLQYCAKRSSNKRLLPLTMAAADCSEHLESALNTKLRWFVRCVALFALFARLFYIVVPDLIQNQTSDETVDRLAIVPALSTRAATAKVSGEPAELPDFYNRGVVGEPFVSGDGNCTVRVATAIGTTNQGVSLAPQPGLRYWCSPNASDAYSMSVSSGNVSAYHLSQPFQTLGTYYVFDKSVGVTAITFAGHAPVSGTGIGINSAFNPEGTLEDTDVQNVVFYNGVYQQGVGPAWRAHETIEQALYAFLSEDDQADVFGFAIKHTNDSVASLLTWGAMRVVLDGASTYTFEYQKYNVTAASVPGSFRMDGDRAIAVVSTAINPTVQMVEQALPASVDNSSLALRALYPVTVYNPLIVIVVVCPIIGALLILTLLALLA